jgi:hypothetical protein
MEHPNQPIVKIPELLFALRDGLKTVVPLIERVSRKETTNQ